VPSRSDSILPLVELARSRALYVERIAARWVHRGSRFRACFHALPAEYVRSTVPQTVGLSFSSTGASPSEFLRPRTRANLSARTPPAWVSYLFAASSERVHNLRGFPAPRFVPPPSFLSSPAVYSALGLRRPVSSRSHVQVSSVFRDFSLVAARPSRRRSCLHAVPTLTLTY
jgi:hypothetical protein